MKTVHRQRGRGLLGLFLITCMVGFFVMSAFRIAPGYLEYLSIRDIVIGVAEEYDPDEDTFADMRRKLADYFNTNQIKTLDAKDIEITRRERKVIINASYEQRVPLIWRIDAVVRYDDLEFIAGERYSD